MASLEDAKTLCREIPEEDLRRLRTWIITIELPQREALPQIEAAEAELVAELQEQHPELAPKCHTVGRGEHAG